MSVAATMLFTGASKRPSWSLSRFAKSAGSPESGGKQGGSKRYATSTPARMEQEPDGEPSLGGGCVGTNENNCRGHSGVVGRCRRLQGYAKLAARMAWVQSSVGIEISACELPHRQCCEIGQLHGTRLVRSWSGHPLLCRAVLHDFCRHRLTAMRGLLLPQLFSVSRYRWV